MASSLDAHRVVELRRAGLSFEQIADRLELASGAVAKSIYVEAIADSDAAFNTELEASRLERMHTAIWPAAAKGDLSAVAQVVKIGERRERLMAPPKENTHDLRRAYDASVQTSSAVKEVDEALIATGRKIADHVDATMAIGDDGQVTKALYLVPHMVNILRELLATPASRAAAGINDREKVGGKLAQLRAVQSDPA